jgi:hypothetical protein
MTDLTVFRALTQREWLPGGPVGHHIGLAVHNPRDPPVSAQPENWPAVGVIAGG